MDAILLGLRCGSRPGLCSPPLNPVDGPSRLRPVPPPCHEPIPMEDLEKWMRFIKHRRSSSEWARPSLNLAAHASREVRRDGLPHGGTMGYPCESPWVSSGFSAACRAGARALACSILRGRCGATMRASPGGLWAATPDPLILGRPVECPRHGAGSPQFTRSRAGGRPNSEVGRRLAVVVGGLIPPTRVGNTGWPSRGAIFPEGSPPECSRSRRGGIVPRVQGICPRGVFALWGSPAPEALALRFAPLVGCRLDARVPWRARARSRFPWHSDRASI